jgi:hypothetical protein
MIQYTQKSTDMFNKIFFILLLPVFLFSENTLYTIKLAAYKNLVGLQQSIKKLPATLQNEVTISEVHGVHKAFVQPTHDRSHLEKKINAYQKVFEDAFITIRTDTPILAKKVTPKKPTEIIIAEKKSIPEAINTAKVSSFQNKLKGKTLYLCAKSKATSGKLLLQVTFSSTSVKYTPILGKIPMATLQYHVKNKKLFVYKKGLFNPQIFTRYESETANYYLMSSWMKKKRVTTMRYYFNLEEAKHYLNVL